MKNQWLKLTLACGLLLTHLSPVNAKTIAITNATLHTATEQGVLVGATLVIEDNKILAINPHAYVADQTIDAKGMILTPGLIGSMNHLGIVEVSMVPVTSDIGQKEADMSFDPSYAFNPKTTAIPFARTGGITSNIVTSAGGEGIFAGQVFAISLTGDWDSIISRNGPLLVNLGEKEEGSRAYSMQELVNQFDDARKAQQKVANASKDKKLDTEAEEPTRASLVIKSVLEREKSLIVHVNRASDILALLKLKQDYGIEMILTGAADAVLVAKQIAKAQVPVIINAMDNLPGSFDSLHNSQDNAAKLVAAGVKVILSMPDDTHGLYGLRFTAGNAVANGMSAQEALKAITANVADVFKLNSGRIEAGKAADLVLWNGDPFEFSTRVEKMWIGGQEQQLESRQDKLRDRYMTPSTMPKAYTH
jgi:imidazolonepropionase-like amidohydrolase